GNTSTVLRGGVGLFSDLYPGTIVDSFARNSPSLNSYALSFLPYSPAEGSISAESTVQGANAAFNANYAAGGNAASFLAAAPPGSAVPTFNSVASTLKNPKYVEWNFEIQRAFGSKTSVNINYVGNRGYDEFVTNNAENSYYCLKDPNTKLCTTATFGSLPVAVPDNHFNVVTLLNNNGTSNYNGVTGTVTRHFTAGFTGSFNYTFSHALDDISNGGVLPYSFHDRFLGQIDPNNLRRLNYGNADYDVRHNISANYVWELPFKTSSGLMNRVISGWSLSGTVFWRSGYPYTVNDGAAIAGAVSGLHNGTTLTILPDFLGGSTPS